MLGAREEKICAALAAAAMPHVGDLEGGGACTVARLERWLEGSSDLEVKAVRALLWAAEGAALARTGRPLTRLTRDRAEAFLTTWQASESTAARALLRAIVTPIKGAHFDDANVFAGVGCTHADARERTVREESPRWMARVTDGREAKEAIELSCEIVVVGTGAGGAACAYELARRGRAVLLLEEGDFHRRSSFDTSARRATKKLYRDQGLTMALGTTGIPVWAGRAVGGSTIVNSGTCYRAPERVFARWRRDLGLTWFSAESMAPYYERVESMLEVARAPFELTGGVGRVVSRGAEKMGLLRHHPLARNAPGCDAQGVCCFGCPTGAKRSTDVSYVPAALERGAELITAAKVLAVDVENARAVGVHGRLASGKTFRVRAECVVIAGGALMTPLILHDTLASPWLGRNLSIHPASKVMAMFDETIDMARAIPQGYAVEDFADQGIMLEGGSTPPDITAIGVPWVGERFMDMMARYRNLATFGLMIEDTSRGRVRPGVGARKSSPLITYELNRRDTDEMARAIALICDLFFAAGARRVMPFVAGMEEMTSAREVAKLRGRSIRPGDFEITAYHPLGTCRIGTDPDASALGPDHESHEIARLYVVDGSAVPTALGVNPQLTIMAMALRAAEGIDARLS